MKTLVIQRAFARKVESEPTRPGWSTTIYIFGGLSRVNIELRSQPPESNVTLMSRVLHKLIIQ